MSPPLKSPESQVHPYTSPCPEVDNDQITVVTSRPILVPDPQNLCPRDANLEDLEKLRHVADKVPRIVWLVAFTGAAQRFAFYGTTVPWQNYLQNPLGDPLSPGALGFGQSTATIINNAFLFLSYLSSIPFAIISDSWLGRYKSLLLSLIIFLAGEIVLFVTSLPFALGDRSTVLGGFITAMVLIGLGQGGTSAVIFSFLGDQIPSKAPRVIYSGKGEIVVTDPKLTIQYVFNTFYWMINIAALATLATTNMEKSIGFWAAYLLPLCFLSVSIILFILWNDRLTKLPPQSDVLPHAGKVLALAARSRFHLSAADPSYQSLHYSRTVPWTSAFVHEIRRGFRACRAVICFTVFYLCFNQSTTNIISQANQMEISGVSNDTVQSLNAIFYIIINPIIQNWLFPFLARRHIAFGPIARMTVSFFLLAVAMGYAAGTQALIYSRGPCFSYPRACEAATVVGVDGVTTEHRPNEVSMWVQAPFHLFLAVGEIFGFVALNEFEYIEAPTNMKALVKAFEQFTAALGAGLSMALGPVSKDPWLVIMNASLAGTMVISGVAFYAVFWKFDPYWHKNQNITNSEDSRVIVIEDSKE
ncbi:hypothetical protein K445DRAFT_301706 [Daldinia sp. EC12]|nr:hypothetical protein K445DRAFT_301706 [Daldinia sp. EC12]